ncbi:hypothetical protein BX616_005377 [Lobosporangium transversale]|nr:hypothetical protein BX616_005377 [Lobosporangium transversale]
MVRAHSNSAGNVFADMVATRTARMASAPWKADLSAQSDIQHFAYFHGQLIEQGFVNFSSNKPSSDGNKHGQPNDAQRERSVTLTIWSSDQRWVDKHPVHSFRSNAKDHIKKPQCLENRKTGLYK